MTTLPNKKSYLNRQQPDYKTTKSRGMPQQSKKNHKTNKNSNIPITKRPTKAPVQKSQQIYDNQYKKAMKHMNHVNKIQQQLKQKQKQIVDRLTSEHTFMPQINDPAQLNYLHRVNFSSTEKLHQFVGSKQKLNGGQMFYDRLLRWGRNHDERVRENYIRRRVNRQGLFSSLQRSAQHSIQKLDQYAHTEASLEKLQQRFISTFNSSSGQRDRPKKFINGEQSFLLRHAKASAIKNGQNFYFKTNHLHDL